MTFKQEIDIIASVLKEDNNDPYKVKIGLLIQSYLQEMVKQYYTKYGHMPPFAIKELKWVPVSNIKDLQDTGANEIFKERYKVYRSVNKIPQGVSLNKPYPFLFVGEPTREDSFDFIMPEDFEFILTRRFIIGGYYTLLDGYLYVFNYTKKAVNIRYVPADIINFLAVTDVNNNLCFDDYEIPEQFSNVIRQMIYKELGVSSPIDTEIEINEDKN